jgi:hypothetical protein
MKKTFTHFLVITFFVSLSISAKSQIFIIQPNNAQGQDTYVSSAQDSTNFSSHNFMYFGGNSWLSDTFNLFIKVDLSSITPGTTVSSARLDLFRLNQNGDMSGYNFGLYKVRQNWKEDTLYWYNRPATNMIPFTTFAGSDFQQGADHSWRSIYIPDSIVQQWIDNPSANFGFRISAVSDFYGSTMLATSESVDSIIRPRMVINSNGSEFSGVVNDSLTGAPLQNVILHAYSISNPVVIAADTTDAAGAFELKVIYPDSFYIQVDGINGYLPRMVDSLVLVEGQNMNLNVKLLPDAHAVSGIATGAWIAANNPYKISGNIFVPDASELIIEPGVDVIFQGHYGIYVEGSLHANGSASDSIIFTSSDTTIASKGRGIRFDEADSSFLEYCKIENMYSFDNLWGQSITDQGGGVYTSNSDLLIKHSTIKNNFANTGGGIYCRSNEQGRNFIARQNLVEHNRSVFNGTVSDGGAGIMVYAANSGGVTIDNNVVSYNSYESTYYNGFEGGGGIYVVGSNANIINNTIVKNYAVKGTGIYCREFEGNIKNNIVWGNYGSPFHDQLAVDVCDTCTPGPGVSIQYNDIQDTAIKILHEITPRPVYYNGIGNIPAYPVFVDTLADNFRLQSTSPCIDNAYNVAVKFFEDYNGNCRVFDGNNDHSGIVDMGAYEYNSDHYLVAPELGSDDSTCANAPLTLHTGIFAGYSWNTGATTPTVVSGNSSSEYFLTVTDSLGCFTWDSVHIKILPVPVAHVTGDSLQCLGSPAVLTTNNGFASYFWNGTIAGNDQFTTSNSGDFWVHLIGTNGCAANSDTMHVDIFHLQQVDLGPDITMHLTESVILSAGHGYDNYSWNTGANTELVTIFGSHFGVGTHMIWVRASTAEGCFSQDTIYVTVLNNVGVDENSTDNICSVFPNPAKDNADITLPSSWLNEEVKITMTDVTGRIVKEYSFINNKKVSIDLNGISAGLYQLTLSNGDKISKAKIIVE